MEGRVHEGMIRIDEENIQLIESADSCSRPTYFNILFA